MRQDGRAKDSVRKIVFTPNYTKHAEGSALIQMGDTWVICTATFESSVPPFLKGGGKGWVTAEYGMLPRATNTRTNRDSTAKGGRTAEIQRLIGRSLRSIIDVGLLGENTIRIDCDVLQADGGTRTASINGSFVALALAVDKLLRDGTISKSPILDSVAAVSVGILGDQLILDLNYHEDSEADVDCNVVMVGSGNIVEIQGTAEGRTFSPHELSAMVKLAGMGIGNIMESQKEVLGKIGQKIGSGDKKSK